MESQKIERKNLNSAAKKIANNLKRNDHFEVTNDHFDLVQDTVSESDTEAVIPYFYEGTDRFRHYSVTKRLLESSADTSSYDEEEGIRLIDQIIRPDSCTFTLWVEWYTYPSGRIRRRYSGVEVPKEFFGWHVDEKYQWLEEMAHSHFGTNGGLEFERKMRDEDLRLEQLNKTRLLDDEDNKFF
jgi:hypothetical protein